jgi:MFS family permease
MPSVLALVTGMFTDEKQRSRAIAVYLSCFMGGATLGPLVGGVLLEYFWWGSVFLVAVRGSRCSWPSVPPCSPIRTHRSRGGSTGSASCSPSWRPALRETAVEFGLGFGIATLATLGTAVYRSNVEDALGAVPPDAADAAREASLDPDSGPASTPSGELHDGLARSDH